MALQPKQTSSSDPAHAKVRKGARPSRRGAARLAAVQALYQIDVTHGDTDAVLTEFRLHRLGEHSDDETLRAVDVELFNDIVRGVAIHPELDDMVAGALSDSWSFDRLEAVLRAILRAGAYELAERPDVPSHVVISEYVDLSHAFFVGREPSMVNAVLDVIAHAVRPDTPTAAGAARAPRG